MRGGVTQDLQRLRAFLGDDFEAGVVVDGEAGIHQLAVHFASQGGLGQAGANGGGHVLHRDGMVEGAFAAVG